MPPTPILRLVIRVVAVGIIGSFTVAGPLGSPARAATSSTQTPELSPEELAVEQSLFEQQLKHYPDVMKAVTLPSGYTPSVVLRLEAPTYPERMANANQNGQVWFELFVESNGKVRDVRILKSTDSAFESVSVEALKQSKFKPALFHGKPVRSHALKNTLEFKLD